MNTERTHTTRTNRPSSIGLGLVALLLSLPGQSWGQPPQKSPDELITELGNGLTQLLFQVLDTLKEVEGLNILKEYCKPPLPPLKSLTQEDLEYFKLRAALYRQRLRAMEDTFNNIFKLPTGASVINYRDSFPDIAGMRPDTTDENHNRKYWAAARDVVGEIEQAIRVKERILKAAPERDCRSLPERQRENPPRDPLSGLYPPRFHDITPPKRQTCYETLGLKRTANNEAYWEEQEAKANEQAAEDYRKLLERYVDFYSGMDGTPEIRARLARMLADAVAAEQAHDAKWEDALQTLEAIRSAKVPCPKEPASDTGPGLAPPTSPPLPAKPPTVVPGQPTEKKTSLVIGTGGLFGAPEGTSTSPPAGAPRNVAQNTVRDVATGFTGPGLDDIFETLDLLDEIDNLIQDIEAFEDLLDEFGPDALAFTVFARWMFNLQRLKDDVRAADARRRFGSALRGVEPPGFRVYAEGGWSTYAEHQAFTNGALQRSAESVQGAWRDGLLRANGTGVTSLDVTRQGGYKGVLHIGGGVERDLRAQMAGFQTAIRAGLALGIPIGSPREHAFSLTYGFATTTTAFEQTDNATLTSKAGVQRGIDGALVLKRAIGNRAQAVLEAGVRIQRSSREVLLSTNPVTTSTQPGAVLFSTPAGSRSILISTIPGLSSSLSTAIVEHPLWSSTSWAVMPLLRFGVMF